MARILTALLFFWIIPGLSSAELKKDTVQAWDQYIRWADAKVRRELSDPNIFLTQNTLPPSERALVKREIESGGIFVRQMTGIGPRGRHIDVPDGEIHHWWGSILIKNKTLPQLMQFLQDYNHHAGKFAEVERSRILSANDNHFQVYFRFKRSKAFVTAVYNTEQDCIYISHGPGRMSSMSVARKIAEVENPGTPSENEKTPGNDRGFLWRLVSWWRFEQRGNDIVIELESASLSRGIPSFVKFLPGISGYIRSTPRESLESVLAGVRENVK